MGRQLHEHAWSRLIFPSSLVDDHELLVSVFYFDFELQFDHDVLSL